MFKIIYVDLMYDKKNCKNLINDKLKIEALIPEVWHQRCTHLRENIKIRPHTYT